MEIAQQKRSPKQSLAEQDWTQFNLAEKPDISDRQIRNLCKRDTDTKLSLCYRMSRVFGTTMEELLTIEEVEDA